MIDVGSAVGYLLLDTHGFSKGIKSAIGDLKVFSDETATFADKSNAVGKVMTSVGSTMTKTITLPLVGIGGAAIKMAMDVEDSFAKVITIADTTNISLEDLKKGVTGVSSATGTAATEINEALYQAISAGADTATALDLVEVAAKSAKGGFTDTATAVDGLTSVLNTYGMATTDAESLANKFIITQNLGKTTFGELASSIGSVAPTAASVGVSIEELLGGVAALTANGIATSESITGLKAAISGVIKPSAEAAEMAASLGLDFSAASLESKGLAGFLDEVAKATGGDVEKMSKLFGSVEALNTVLTLTSDQGSTLMNDTLNQMATNTTALQDAFDVVTSTSSESWKMTLNDIKNVVVEIGNKLLPIINDLLETYIKPIANWLGGLNEKQLDMIVKIGLVVAAIGPLMMAAGNLLILVGSVAGAMTMYATETFLATAATYGFLPAILAVLAPFAPLILAIGGAVLAFTLLWNHCEGFRNFWLGLWEDVKIVALATWEILKVFFTKTIPEAFTSMVQFFKDLPTNIMLALTNLLGRLADWSANFLKWVKDSIPKVIDAIVNFFKELPYNIGYAIGYTAGVLVKWGTNLIATVKTEVPKIINAILTFFAELPEKIWNFLVMIWTAYVDFCVTCRKTVIEETPKIIEAILTFFRELPGKIWAFLVQTVTNLITWGGNMKTEADKAAKNTFNAVVDGIKDLPAKMLELGGQIVQGLIDGIKGLASGAVTAIKNVGQGIIDGFSEANEIHSPSRVFYALGLMIVQGLANALYDNSGLPTKQMDRIARMILSSGNEISTGLITFDKKTGTLIYSNTYKAIMDKIDLYYKERDKRIKLLDSGTDASLKAIDSEIKATEQAYDIKMKLYEQEYNAKLALIDAETASIIASYQAEIDAIDAVEEQESRDEATAEYEKELAEKQALLDAAIINNEDYSDIQEEIDSLMAQRKKELLAQQRSDEKDALRQQIEEAREKATEDKDEIRSVYEEKKWQLEQQKIDEMEYLAEMQTKLQEDYDKRKELEEIQTEIKKAEEEGRTADEIAELKKRETELINSLAKDKIELTKFGEDFKIIANGYGESFLSGFKSTETALKTYLDEIKAKADSAKAAIDAAASVPTGGTTVESSGVSELVGTQLYGAGMGEESLYAMASSYSSDDGLYSAIGRNFTSIANRSALIIDYEKLGAVIAANAKPDITMNNEFTSPKALSEQEIKRNQEFLLRDLAFDYDL